MTSSDYKTSETDAGLARNGQNYVIMCAPGLCLHDFVIIRSVYRGVQLTAVF